MCGLKEDCWSVLTDSFQAKKSKKQPEPFPVPVLNKCLTPKTIHSALIIKCQVRLDFVWISPKKTFLILAVSVIFDVFPLVLSKSKEKWKMEEGREGQVRWQCVQKFCIRSSNYSLLTFWGRISERIAFSEVFLYGNIRHKKWRKGKC